MDKIDFNKILIGRIDINEALQTIKDYIEKQNKTISRLQEKLATYNKDEEIQKLEKKIEDMYRNDIYEKLSDKEIKAEDDFIHKHYKNCKGNTRIILEGTGIGTIIKLQCTKCGEIEDITDTSNW